MTGMMKAGLGRAVLVGLAASATACSPETEALLGIDVYFVKLEAEPADVAATAAELAEDFGVDVIHTYDSASEGFSTKLPSWLVPEIEALPQVEYVLGDETVERLPPEEQPADEPIDDPIELLDGDEVPESIVRVGGAYGGSLRGLEVAVIDTGIDGAHPDLNVVASIDLVAASGSAPEFEVNAMVVPLVRVMAGHAAPLGWSILRSMGGSALGRRRLRSKEVTSPDTERSNLLLRASWPKEAKGPRSWRVPLRATRTLSRRREGMGGPLSGVMRHWPVMVSPS